MNIRTALISFISFLIIFLPETSRGEELDDSYSCTVCHSDKKNEFLGGIHYQYGIMCESCHGGDPAAMDDQAHSRSAAFKGDLKDGRPPLSKKQIVELCSSCHSNAIMMRQYGIPSNQESLYRISQHGKSLYEKNSNDVAVCTDCHGTHQILPASDPRSSIYIKNLPAMCANCHSDQTLMTKYQLPWDTFEQFSQSVHGQALFENNDLRSPNCAFCHGVHGAMPPHVSEVENVCGQCHSRSREYFNKSPHKLAMDKREMNECVECHDSHAMQAASLEMFDTVCLGCHDASSGAYRLGQNLQALIIEASGAIEDAWEEAEKAHKLGLNVEKYEQELIEAETNLIRISPVIHALSSDEIERYTRTSITIADDVKLELFHQLEERQWRKYTLFAVWAFVLVSVPVILIRRYRISERLQHEK